MNSSLQAKEESEENYCFHFIATFHSFWSNISELYSLPVCVNKIFQNYLFHQNCSSFELVMGLLSLIEQSGRLYLRDPVVTTLTNCLLLFWDNVRKFQDDQVSRASLFSLSCAKLLHSFGTAIFYLILIFEMSCRQVTCGHCSLPKVIRRSVTKSISIIGLNCANYDAIVSDPLSSSSIQILSEKINILFGNIPAFATPLDQKKIFDYFHNSYYHLVPQLFDDFFGDLDERYSHHIPQNAEDLISYQHGANVDVEQPKKKVSVIHLKTLSNNVNSNTLLSRSRISPMNGHRIALENRLLQHHVTRESFNAPRNHSKIDNELRKTQERISNPLETSRKKSRRIVIEDTPVRKC